MKKILSVIMIIALIMTLATGSAFAAVGTVENGNEIPVYLNAPAIGEGEGGIDFTITDSITMTASAGSTVLSISNLNVTNNAATGQLKIDSIEVSSEGEWKLAEDDAEYFANLKADSKFFSMVSEGNDFSQKAKAEYGETKLLAADGGAQIIKFSGHIGTFKTEVKNASVAKVVATISVY